MSKSQEEYENKISELEEIISELQEKLEKVTNKSGRKLQVLEILRKGKPVSILDIANEIEITTKNVSSQLTYLRIDGYQIFTDPNGKKVIIE